MSERQERIRENLYLSIWQTFVGLNIPELLSLLKAFLMNSHWWGIPHLKTTKIKFAELKIMQVHSFQNVSNCCEILT